MSDSDSDEEWETARREHKQQVQPDDGHLSPATSVTSATSGGLDEPEHEERPARSPLRLRTVPSSPHYRLSSEDEDDDTDVAVGGRVLSDEMDDSDGTFMDEVPSEDEQEEEGASAPIAYIGVAKPIKSLRHAIEDIKAEVLGPPPERPPSAARAWKAADEERLLRAIAGATEIPVPEEGEGPSYETFARAVGREIEDVMVHMQEAKGHAAMRLARKLLGMELLMEATDQGEQFVEHGDGDGLASYLIREELEIRPHRALHVDVQQVCDRLSLQVGGMQTGWNVLREHKEMEAYVKDEEDGGLLDANLAVDIIEKGEQVFATDAQTCRPEDCSVEEWEHNPLCRGCGVVRLRIVRHYHNGRLVPNSEVEAEREDLAAQLTEYEAQHGVRSLRERAQRAWDEHPDRTGEEDDPSPAFGMMGRQELVDEILATEIIEFPLWASMYSEEGRRLLELLPMHGDVQPSKPISFGSRRGLTAVRNTHSVHERDGTEGTGHANTERQPLVSGRQEQRALESSFVHESRKQRARRKGRRTRTALDRSHSRSMASATEFPTGLPTPNRHSRSAALERSLSESGGGGGGKPMDQSLHMWLQSHHLQGCEAKLVRIGVTSPRSLARVADGEGADGQTLLSEARLTDAQVTRIKQGLAMDEEQEDEAR